MVVSLYCGSKSCHFGASAAHVSVSICTSQTMRHLLRILPLAVPANPVDHVRLERRLAAAGVVGRYAERHVEHYRGLARHDLVARRDP